MIKNLPASAGDIRDTGLIPGLGRSPGGGHGNPLQYSCLENPMDRGACWAMVHRVVKSQAQLKQLSMHGPMMNTWVVPPFTIIKTHTSSKSCNMSIALNVGSGLLFFIFLTYNLHTGSFYNKEQDT